MTRRPPDDQLDLFGPAPAAPGGSQVPAPAPAPQAAHADEEGRRAARTIFDRPVILEAGAGTGKTAALVSRVLAWCLGPGWERSRTALLKEGAADPGGEAIAARTLERVASITFTERAAVEMERKVARALAGLLAGEDVVGLPRSAIDLDDAGLRRRAGALTTCLDRFNVGTIHAFCSRILRRHALEVGIDPSFAVDAEGDRVKAAVEEAVGECLQEVYGDPGDDDFVHLAALDVGPQEIAETVRMLAGESVPPEAFQDDPYSDATVAVERDRLRAALAGLIPILDKAFGHGPARARKAADALTALQKLDHHLAAATNIDDLVRAVRAEDLLDSFRRLSAWRKTNYSVTEIELLGEEAMQEVTARCRELYGWLRSLERIDPVVLPAGCRAVSMLLGRVREILRSRGVETFQDLLEDTRRLLLESEPVRALVRASLDQLLVDEFQDTDPVQCEILRLLALEGDDSRRPGLFLVGDPKQSIYGWRNADLEAYESFVEQAGACGGVLYPLTVNFRSAPPVLQEVHRLLSPILVRRERLQPEYHQLVASEANRHAPGYSDERRRPAEHWVSWDFPRPGEPDRKFGYETSAATAREIEARAIALDMRELADRGVAWKEMALLLRVSTSQETYLARMRELGIPYVVERDRTFYQHREVIDAASLLRAVVDPHDQVALVGLLRSPWIGVPDAAWLPLWGVELPKKLGDLAGPDPERLADLEQAIDEAAGAVPGGIPGLDDIAGWPASLKAAVRALAELRLSFQSEPADRFVEKLKALPLVEEVEAARFLSHHRLANLDRFFRGVLDALAEGEGGPQMVLRALREGVAGERREEVGPPGDETLDAVRVLTIHVAKGLEFDHVYVADLHHRPYENTFGESTPTVRRHEGRWEMQLFGATSLGFHRTEERTWRVGAAEEIRTLYVAATRAAQRLVLAGRWPDPGKEAPELSPTWSAPFVDYLQHRAGSPPNLALHLGAVAQAGPGGDDARIDEAGVRWRIPVTDETPAAGVHRAGRPVTEEQARRELALLETARGHAALLGERPFLVAASAQAHGASEEPVAPGAFADRSRAAAVGVAVHRGLEELEPGAAAAAVLRDLERRADTWLEAFLPAAERGAARKRLRELLRSLSGHTIVSRLAAIAPHILGREVPLLLRDDRETGAAGASVGTMDLLYRDPSSGAPVVADYKTDRVDDGSGLRDRARVYESQGAVYVEAARRFLGEEPAPRFELWFLAADTILGA